MSYLTEHYDEIFKKYSDEDLRKDVNSYINGGGYSIQTLKSFFQGMYL